MRPFTRREAVLSSKIEGTQATLGELLAAEAGIAVERSPDDLREVGNYVTGMPAFRASLSELQMWQVSQMLANANDLPLEATNILTSEPAY